MSAIEQEKILKLVSREGVFVVEHEMRVVAEVEDVDALLNVIGKLGKNFPNSVIKIILEDESERAAELTLQHTHYDDRHIFTQGKFEGAKGLNVSGELSMMEFYFYCVGLMGENSLILVF